MDTAAAGLLVAVVRKTMGLWRSSLRREEVVVGHDGRHTVDDVVDSEGSGMRRTTCLPKRGAIVAYRYCWWRLLRLLDEASKGRGSAASEDRQNYWLSKLDSAE